MKNKDCKTSSFKNPLLFVFFSFICFFKLKKVIIDPQELAKMYRELSYTLHSFPSMVLFLKHGHRKLDLIFLITYQNKDKSHAIFLHLLHQQTKVLKAGTEGEVQLLVHVINVYMLNILQEGQARCWGSSKSDLRA